MDSSAFDHFSRSLVSYTNRRGILGGLASALTGLLGRGGTGNAGARARTCRPLNRHCFPDRGLDCCDGSCRNGRCRCLRRQRACRGQCIPKRQCCGNGHCGGGQVCRNGRCQCPARKRRCRERCIGPNACCRDGECGAGGSCRNGRCRCAGGFKPCQGGCIAQAACCGGCDPDQNCVNGNCEAKRCGTGAPCRVFATSTIYPGDLREGGTGSGIAGADAKCQAQANASARTQGGTYKAWLSGTDADTSPSERFTNIANTGPYVLVDDAATVIADDWSGLTDGTLDAAISVTEAGGPATNPVSVWTATLPDGTPNTVGSVINCQEWTTTATGFFGRGGFSTLTDAGWTAVGFGACEFNFRLYCFEQG